MNNDRIEIYKENIHFIAQFINIRNIYIVIYLEMIIKVLCKFLKLHSITSIFIVYGCRYIAAIAL